MKFQNFDENGYKKRPFAWQDSLGLFICYRTCFSVPVIVKKALFAIKKVSVKKASVCHTCSALPTYPYLSGLELHVFEESEDEMKQCMITTRKTIVHHGNVMTAMIWTL